MGKVLVFLLFLGAGFGVYKIFEEYKAKQKASRNLWPDRMAAIMRLHASKTLMSGEILGNQASFLQLVYLAYQAEQDGYPVLDTLRSAYGMAGMDNNEGPLVSSAVFDNLTRARQLGAFQDPANLPRMERGDPPVANAPGWEGEPLVVGYKISPVLGAELSAVLPNLVIMPESARDMQTDLLPPEAKTLVNQWLSIRMISPEAATAIREKILSDAKVR